MIINYAHMEQFYARHVQFYGLVSMAGRQRANRRMIVPEGNILIERAAACSSVDFKSDLAGCRKRGNKTQ